MKAKDFAMANPLVVIGAVVALWVVIRGPTQIGKDLGNLVGNLAGGAVSGTASAAGNVAGAVISAPMLIVTAAADTVNKTASNPDTNPLYGLGSWVGGSVYDLFHPTAGVSFFPVKVKKK